MSNEETLERLKQMEETFREEGLQGYELTMINTINLMNNLIARNKELEERLNNAVDKDKIKYKIEELDRELQLCEKQHIDTIKAYTPIDIIKAEIIKLQELLQEGDK